MNGLLPLTFYWTSWSAIFSLAVVALSACLSYAAWRRSGYRRSIGFLELCGWRIVFVAVLFNQPEWVEEYRPEEKPSVAVLWTARQAWRRATQPIPATHCQLRPGARPLRR